MRDDDAKPTTPDDASVPSGAQADRERRQRALSEIARTATSSGAGTRPSASPATARVPLNAPKRPRSARGVLLGALALVVIVAGVGVYVWRAHQPAKTTVQSIPVTLTINLTKVKLYCPQSLTWSPDGLTVAVFVTRTSCANGGSGNPVVALLNARTGALERTLDPYAALAAANVQGAYVQDVVWSPDRKSLIFLVNYNPNLVNTRPGSGLLYYSLSGGSPRYVAGPASPDGGVIWNLRTDVAVTTFKNPLPSAASYSWSSDGHLIADTARSTAPGHFSLFRTGTIQPIQPSTQASPDSPDPSAPPVTLMYFTWSTLVSPDGTYATMSAERGARLPVSSTAPAPVLDQQLCGYYSYYHLCDDLPLTPPDAGLAAVVTATTLGYTYSPDGTHVFTQWNSVDLAYRPDGKVLAAILPDAVAQYTAIKHITLFDTSSGEQIGVVTAPTVPNIEFGGYGFAPLSWSPSGKQLAYYDYGASTITIWGGSSLPN